MLSPAGRKRVQLTGRTLELEWVRRKGKIIYRERSSMYRLHEFLVGSSSRSRNSKTRSGKQEYTSLEPRNLLAPVVGDDLFSGLGNTVFELRADGMFSEGPSVKVTGSLFENDGAGVVLESYDAVSANGATVEVQDDGSFHYSPVPGLTNFVDTFTYTVSDGSGSASATVSVDFTDLIWYLDFSAIEPGVGTSNRPLNSLSLLNANDGLGDLDSPGDTIFVMGGVGETLTPVTLEADQILQGTSVDFVRAGMLVEPAGSVSGIENPQGDTIYLGNNNSIVGMHVGSGRDGISINDRGFRDVDSMFLANSSIIGGRYGLSLFRAHSVHVEVVDSSFSGMTTAIFAELVGLELGVSGSSITDVVVGIDSRGRHGDSRVIGNVFERIESEAIKLQMTESFQFDVSGNQFINVLAHGGAVKIYGDRADDHHTESRMVDNEFVLDNPFDGVAIAVDGSFLFTNETFDFDLETDYRSGIVLSHVKFQDVTIDVMDPGVQSYLILEAFGDLHINEFVAVGSESRGNRHLVFTGNSKEDFRLSFGNIDLYTRPASWFNGDLTFRKLDLTIDVGTIRARRFTIADCHLDVNLGATRLFGGDLRIENVTGRLQTNDYLIVENGKMLLEPGEGAELTFNRKVWVFHRRVEDSSPLPIVRVSADSTNHQVAFEGGVEFSSFHNTVYIDGASVSFGGKSAIVAHGGRAKTAFEAVNGAELLITGETRIQGASDALVVRDSMLTIASPRTQVFAGNTALHMENSVVGAAGVSIQALRGDSIYLDLMRDETTGVAGDVSISGKFDTKRLSIATESNVNFTNPNSTTESFRVFSDQQVQAGTIRFDGRIDRQTVDSPDPLFLVENQNEMDVFMNGPVESGQDGGIQIAGNAYVEFGAPVVLGSTENRNSDGVVVVDAATADVVFAEGLAIFTESDTGIDATGHDSALNIAGLHLDVVDGIGINVVDFEGFRVDGGTSRAGRGQLMVANNVSMDVVLDRVDAAPGDKPAIDIDGSTGQFAVRGAGETERGGDGSGGTLHQREQAGLRIRNSENVSFRNLVVSESRGHGILLENVDGITISNSAIVGSGRFEFEKAIFARNLSGDVRLTSNVFGDTLGLTDVWITQTGGTELVLAVEGNQFTSRSQRSVPSFVFSGYARSISSVVLSGNEWGGGRNDKILARMNGFAELDLVVSDNLIQDFRRGVTMLQYGSSQLNYDIARNSIRGRADGSSQYAILASGSANRFGGGYLGGQIRNHRGQHGQISNSDGIRLNLSGTQLASGESIGTTGAISIHNNRIDRYDGFAAVNVKVDGQDSHLDLEFTGNALVAPQLQNAVGLRLLIGGQSSGLATSASLTVKDNNTVGGHRGPSAAYQLVQRHEAVLNLTAPAGAPEIGQSFIHSDGGVIMSTGDSGNNNVNRRGNDVIVNGTVNIIEEN